MSYETPWRSLGDSNPCFRRERATSWAARRRERPIRNSRDGAAAQEAFATCPVVTLMGCDSVSRFGCACGESHPAAR
jgi:hypothetical protein